MGNVNIEHVSKRFADELAVDDVSIDVEDGEFVTLVGPSGSGKSTTLEMVAGLTTPSDGEVWIDGNEVTNKPPKDRDIAMVFQNIALFPHMDVYDNISFGLRLRDYDKADIDRRVKEAARILQIEELLDRMPDELSGGQRQRVAIGRAIVRKPAAFLMDEPLANLDAKLRTHMRTELQRLHKQLDTTIIYVTHDQAEAMTMSNRIAILDKGKLQQIAPPLTCYNEPANTFVAGFIGSPAMNQFHGELTENGLETEHFALEFDPSQLQGAATGDRIVVGIRPEDVYRSDGSAVPTWTSRPIPTRVDVREPMGDEIFVYLLFEEQPGEAGDRSNGPVTGEGTGRPTTAEPTEDALLVEPDETTAAGEHADVEDQLLMSMEPDADVEAERLDVVFDLSKVHLFDAETGEALIHGIAELRDETTAARSTESDA